MTTLAFSYEGFYVLFTHPVDGFQAPENVVQEAHFSWQFFDCHACPDDSSELAPANSQARSSQAAHFIPLRSSRMGEKTGRTGLRKLSGQDKDREITYDALSWAKEP